MSRNKESERARLRAYYLEHRDEFLERARQRREAHPEENRENYQKNRERLLERKYQEAATPIGYLKRAYNRQLKSSKERGHQPPAYTVEELIGRYAADPEFLALHQAWLESGRDKKLAPSFDRKRNAEGYSFDNIELTTWAENDRRFREEWKIPVLVFKGDLWVGRYESLQAAREELGICHQSSAGPFLNSDRKTKGYLVYSEEFYQTHFQNQEKQA